MTEQFAILITSCDKYSDLWEGFFSQLNKNLSLPLKKYLLSNHNIYDGKFSNQVETICIGEDLNWSDGLKRCLEQIPERKLLVILEDFFISKAIDKHFMLNAINFSINQDAQILHCEKVPGSVKSNFSSYAKCEPGSPYLISVCAIWDREYLNSLLINGENPWQFEVFGSYRAQFSANRVYCMKSPLFEFKNMIQKGFWVKSNIVWAKKNQIPIDFGIRPIQSSLSFYFKDFYFQIILQLPWQLRVAALNFLRKVFVSY